MTKTPPEPVETERKGILIGYARVSMSDQNNQRQIDELMRYGVDRRAIFQDNASGKSFARPGWNALWKEVERGDTLVILSVDRLGRNVIQVLMTIDDLQQRGIGLKVLNGDIDTTTPTGRMMLSIFATLAEWERSMIVQRTKHGIDMAKKRGVVGGRPPKITADMVQEALRRQADGEYLSDIAVRFKVHKNTLYKRMEAFRKAKRAKEIDK